MRKPKGEKKPQPASDKKYTFFEDVWEVVRLIPKGRVTSYGAIAKYLGSAGSARTVGYAMNASHSSKKKIPAHRVVNSKGMLSGKHHFGSSDAMEYLLKKEGIQVKKDCIVDFDGIFWNPSTELLI